jgi:diguanylate cyclase (GGDEF)-like protein/PAS domain S-box-containing protein
MKRQLDPSTLGPSHDAALLGSVLASLDEGIIVFDTNGFAIACNHSATLLFDRTADEMVGQRAGAPVIEMVTSDGVPVSPENSPALQVIRSGETIRDVRYVITLANGTRRWLSVHIVPLVDPATQARLGAVSSVRDVTERVSIEDQLRFQADHDELTGVLNRRRFLAELERELARASRYGEAGALLVIDLDDLKAINDLEGHAGGDRFLRLLGTALQEDLRASDLVGRLGGDEFAVCAPRSSLTEAGILAERLLLAVSGPGAARSGDEPAPSVSIGIASFADAGTSAAALLEAADDAMYAAKRAGGGRWMSAA